MDQKTFEFLRQHSVNFLTMALENDRSKRYSIPMAMESAAGSAAILWKYS